MAVVMTANRIQTEHLMRNWMRGWRTETGLNVVTVTVEWGDVEIARGQTTQRGDRVTIRG